MLKITDSSGETIGVLEDEDSAPKMIDKKSKEEGDIDGTVGTVAKSRTNSPKTETNPGA